MQVIVFDTETCMPLRGEKAEMGATPQLVCLAYKQGSEPVRLLSRLAAVEWFTGAIYREDYALAAHNVQFDARVLLRAAFEETGVDHTPGVFRAFKEGRLRCTQIREALLGIAGGGIPLAGLGLGTLVKQHFNANIDADKKNPWSWRYRFAELQHTPVVAWPKEARRYAKDDVDLLVRLYAHQQQRGAEARLLAEDGQLVNERFQTAASWWCGLVGARGLVVDYDHACMLAAEYTARMERAAHELRRLGLLRAAGSQDTKAKQAMFEEAFASIGEAPRRTDTGRVATDKAAAEYLEEMEAGGEGFTALRAYTQAEKFLSTYLQPILEAGALGHPLNHSLNPLVDSGRTSARGPNVQNFPARASAHERGRAVTGPMIRGCFVPRPGHVFVSADYKAVEMVGLAQVCANLTGEVGALGQAINAGKDIHLLLAAQMRGSSYEDTQAAFEAGDASVKRLRQLAKVVNFGAPGGCSARTLAQQAKAQGVPMSESEAAETLRYWADTFPEMRGYFAHVRNLEDAISGLYLCEQHGPGRQVKGWRRRVTDRYTSASNTFFQGIVSDGAKSAGWLLAQACYANKEHPLYKAGAAMVLFVHDEFVLEVPAEHEAVALEWLPKIMCEGMRRFCPDIRVEANPETLVERWAK